MSKRPQSSHMQPTVHERLYKQELEKTKVAQAKMQQLHIENERIREIKMLKSPKR